MASRKPRMPCPQSPKTYGTRSLTRCSTMISAPFISDIPALRNAQVGLLDPAVVEQLGARAGHRQRPPLEHVRALGQVERAVHVLLDEQDRGALPVDLGQQLEEPHHHD